MHQNTGVIRKAGKSSHMSQVKLRMPASLRSQGRALLEPDDPQKLHVLMNQYARLSDAHEDWSVRAANLAADQPSAAVI